MHRQALVDLIEQTLLASNQFSGRSGIPITRHFADDDTVVQYFDGKLSQHIVILEHSNKRNVLVRFLVLRREFAFKVGRAFRLYCISVPQPEVACPNLKLSLAHRDQRFFIDEAQPQWGAGRAQLYAPETDGWRPHHE